MNYAVTKIGCQQYQVSEGQVLAVDALPGKAKDKVEFDKVLLLNEEDKIKVGKPYLAKVKILAEIVEHFKDDKVRVAKFRAKSRYHKAKGHRQHKTRIKITKITSK